MIKNVFIACIFFLTLNIMFRLETFVKVQQEALKEHKSIHTILDKTSE